MEHLAQRKKIVIMLAVMSALLFVALNQTIIGTALPKIVAALGGYQYFNWVFTIFMLISSVTAILSGKLSDIYGRKPFLLLGILIFSAGSFLCGLSASIMHLIIFRGIQGFGGGLIMSSAFTVVGDLFPPRERGRWQGLMGASFGLASVLGPTLGGYIADHADWHWIFWIFLPVGVAAFLLIWKLFPAVEKKPGETVDYFGSLFLTVTLITMLLAFSWAGEKYAWSSAQILGLFAVSAAALAVFIAVEHRGKSPIMPLSLFKNSIFSISNAAGFLLGIGMFGTIMYMPFFIQGVFGGSATESGFIMMPMTLSMVLSSTLAGQRIAKSGKYKNLGIAGLAVMALGLLSLYLMDINTTAAVMIGNMIITGIGLGITFPVFTLTVQNAVDHHILGVATAANMLFRQMGGTIGVALMGTVLNHRLSARMAAEGGGAAPEVPPEFAAPFAQLANPRTLMDSARLDAIRQSLPADQQPAFDQLIALLREALDYALSGVFMFGVIVLVLAIALTLLLKELPLRSTNLSPEDEVKARPEAEQAAQQQAGISGWPRERQM
jgi:EmrB/QacA subfamily drug resistance transporter